MDELISAIEKLAVVITKAYDKSWIDYFIAFAPLLLSIVSICISICTSRKQNKIALLDKRLAIYTDLKICISKVITEGKVTTQNANMFIFKARDVKFLFNDDVEKLCKEIYKSMLKLRCVGVKVEAGINGSKNVGNHEKNCDEEAILLEKMFEYSKALEEAFSPYISFKKRKKHDKEN